MLSSFIRFISIIIAFSCLIESDECVICSCFRRSSASSSCVLRTLPCGLCFISRSRRSSSTLIASRSRATVAWSLEICSLTADDGVAGADEPFSGGVFTPFGVASASAAAAGGGGVVVAGGEVVAGGVRAAGGGAAPERPSSGRPSS